MPLEQSDIRPAPWGQGKVIAVFSYRYDAHLVPGLLANIEPVVQGWMAWDDRSSSGALTDEPARRVALIEAARAAGADWILAVDPDERFERDLALRIGAMTRRDRPPALWSFRVCELFTPDAWRTDGIWGAKRQMRLFPASVANPSPAALHGRWVEDARGLPLRDSRLRLYHLRMATPERRRHRRDTYASADPERRFQAIGYDYLANEAGQVLRTVEPDRGFEPPYQENGGLWAPPAPDLPPGPPDSPAARLRYIDAARRRRGAASVLRIALDLAQPGRRSDPALLGLAGQLGLEANRPDKVERYLSRMLDEDGADPSRTAFLRLLRARTRLRRRDAQGAASDLAVLRQVLPGAPLVRRLAQATQGKAPFDAPRASWRRWAGAGATLSEGRNVAASAAMAVVVIGFRAPPELRSAVASALAQDPPAEVVVVNTGGGDATGLLALHLDRIRMICCEAPLYVGAARNIGIDASRAPFVAFLASDCTARPGWVAGRLARHRAGAPAVANPVVPERTGNLVSRAVNLISHHRRHPLLPEDEALRYGVSYARWLFRDLGYFPPGLRIGEDTAFNDLVGRTHVIDWAPEVLTTHRYPTGLGWLLRDQFARGRRRALVPPYAPLATRLRSWVEVLALQRQRLDSATAAAGRFAPTKGAYGVALRALIRLGLWADTLGVLANLRPVARAARLREAAVAASRTEPASAVPPLLAALALNPQDPALRVALAAAHAASGAPEAERRAIRACREAFALAPNSVRAMKWLCDRLVAQGHPGRALAEAEAAVARAPASAAFWGKAASLALRQRDLGRALFYAQGALALSPSDVGAHRRLARIHRRLGQPHDARLREQWARSLGPEPAK